MRRRFMLVTLAVICLFVCILCKSMFSITEDDEMLYIEYQRQSAVVNPLTLSYISMTVDEIVNDYSQDDKNVEFDSSCWIEVCDKVHKEWGRVGAVYAQKSEELILWGDSSPVTVFTDCSGYVGYCLYCFNRVTSSNAVNGSLTHPIHSCTGWDDSNQCGHFSDAEAYGASRFLPDVDGFDVYTDLKVGDILWYSGHVEVFKGYSNTKDKPYVYNWGGHRSAQDLYKNVDESNISSIKSYTKSGQGLKKVKAIWRLH